MTDRWTNGLTDKRIKWPVGLRCTRLKTYSLSSLPPSPWPNLFIISSHLSSFYHFYPLNSALHLETHKFFPQPSELSWARAQEWNFSRFSLAGHPFQLSFPFHSIIRDWVTVGMKCSCYVWLLISSLNVEYGRLSPPTGGGKRFSRLTRATQWTELFPFSVSVSVSLHLIRVFSP